VTHSDTNGCDRPREDATVLQRTPDAVTVWDEDVNAGVVSDSPEEAGRRAFDEVIEKAEAAGVSTDEASVVNGAPHRAVVNDATERTIDLIIMGTHGRTGVDRVLLGSVTERVVRLSDVPVLTTGADETPE
jgi:nucleotide-binding universal stress UspA family protein